MSAQLTKVNCKLDRNDLFASVPAVRSFITRKSKTLIASLLAVVAAGCLSVQSASASVVTVDTGSAPALMGASGTGSSQESGPTTRNWIPPKNMVPETNAGLVAIPFLLLVCLWPARKLVRFGASGTDRRDLANV